MKIDHLLTSEVARICAVSSETVREWNRTGQLPAEKTATGVRLFNPRIVAAFAEQRARHRPAVAPADADTSHDPVIADARCEPALAR